MRKFAIRLASMLCCLGVAACGSGNGAGGSAVPASIGAGADSPITAAARSRRTPAPTPTGSGPTGGGTPAVVQQFSYATASGGSDTSATVTLGTNGSAHVAPKSGDLLVALIAVDGNRLHFVPQQAMRSVTRKFRQTVARLPFV